MKINMDGKQHLLENQNKFTKTKEMCVCRYYVIYVWYDVGGSTEREADHRQPILWKPVGYNNGNHFRESEAM